MEPVILTFERDDKAQTLAVSLENALGVDAQHAAMRFAQLGLRFAKEITEGRELVGGTTADTGAVIEFLPVGFEDGEDLDDEGFEADAREISLEDYESEPQGVRLRLSVNGADARIGGLSEPSAVLASEVYRFLERAIERVSR
jgi:hypothetical protein